jgi:hypothetical protein
MLPSQFNQSMITIRCPSLRELYVSSMIRPLAHGATPSPLTLAFDAERLRNIDIVSSDALGLSFATNRVDEMLVHGR